MHVDNAYHYQRNHNKVVSQHKAYQKIKSQMIITTVKGRTGHVVYVQYMGWAKLENTVQGLGSSVHNYCPRRLLVKANALVGGRLGVVIEERGRSWSRRGWGAHGCRGSALGFVILLLVLRLKLQPRRLPAQHPCAFNITKTTKQPRCVVSRHSSAKRRTTQLG